MVKNLLIEKTYVVGIHWNCLVEAITMCTFNICYLCGNSNVYLKHMLLKITEKTIENLHFPSRMSIVFTSSANQY